MVNIKGYMNDSSYIVHIDSDKGRFIIESCYDSNKIWNHKCYDVDELTPLKNSISLSDYDIFKVINRFVYDYYRGIEDVEYTSGYCSFLPEEKDEHDLIHIIKRVCNVRISWIWDDIENE